jgi:hypothetical protein
MPNFKIYVEKLVELFVECLRTLLQTKKDTFFEQADIEAFIQKAFPLYCSNVSASQIIHEDPLQVAQRVYLGKMCECSVSKLSSTKKVFRNRK